MLQLVEYLEPNGLLSAHQFGFRKFRSVEDQLLATWWSCMGFLADIYIFILF